MAKNLTPNQYKRLTEELDVLRKEQKENAIAKAEAYSRGDLSENAEYELACQKASILDMSIRNIEGILKEANVVAYEVKDKDDGRIIVGDRVTLRIDRTDIPELSRPEGCVFEIVHDMGSTPLDGSAGELSIQQPVGKLLCNLSDWRKSISADGTVIGKTINYRDRDNVERTLHILKVEPHEDDKLNI